MNSSKSSTVAPSEWPVVPQPANGDLAHLTDSREPSGPPRPRIICVLGMHRSGTSVVTRLINLLGVDLGAEEHLLGPRPDNPKGFWEHEPIVQLNEAILDRLGGKWHEPPLLLPGWETSPDFADLRQSARDLIARSFASTDWGWKDPRTCLTLPFWKGILPPIHYVICMRSPAEVAASLEQRENLPIEKSIRLWHVYTAAAIEQTAGLPRHFLFYADLIHSHRDEVSRLARFLGRSESLAQPGISSAIDDFLEPESYRHRTSLINTLDNPKILFPAKALYFAVQNAAKTARSCLGLPHVQEPDTAEEHLWSVFSLSSRSAQAEGDDLTRTRAHLESRTGELSALAQDLRVQIAELESKAADREAAEAALQDRLRELVTNNERLSHELDQAETLLNGLRAALNEREAACDEQASLIIARNAEIAALSERAALVQPLEEHRRTLEAQTLSTQARLGELEADNRNLVEQRDRAQSLIAELRAELAIHGTTCQEQACVIASRDAEVRALTDRVALVERRESDRQAHQAEMAALRARLDAIASESRRQRDEQTENDSRLEAHIANLDAQIRELAAELAPLTFRGAGGEAAMLELRDQLFDRHDKIQAMISRLAETLADERKAPAESAPIPDSMLAVCDMPGTDLLTIGPGHLRVRGWALAKSEVESVNIFIDGLPHEGVAYGSARFDVEAAHPEFPNAHHSGFVGKLDLQGLPNGEHSMLIRVRSRDGGELELERSFRIDPDARPDRRDLNAEYPAWLTRHTPSESDLARMRLEGMNLRYQPVISLVVPVYNTPEAYLKLMVDSVAAQTYSRWELCLANGGSTAPHVRPFLTRLAEQHDPRIKIVHLPHNLGISGHSNAALALATGEFMGLLDSDDVLMPHALFQVVRALNEAPGTDLIYSDEDKTDDTGEDRWDPFFKPDWSPDLLLSNNYICHFGVYRRSLVHAIGGFRSEYDWSQDYDLVLRFTERTDRIVHLPEILYSWRAIPGSTARDMRAKPDAVDAARRAVDDALRRRGIAGHAEPGYSLGQWRVRYELRDQPAVTVVIAAGGNMKCLQPCLASVLERSTYPNLHVLVTDDSDGTAVAELCRDLGRRHPRLKYQRFRLKPFNYSAINNSAVSVVDTPYVVLLNDDVTVDSPEWIEAMLEHAQRPEVGIVGALLLYPDRSLQHAGVIMGPYQNCAHAFRHFSENDPGYFSLARIIRNCSAVTFACAMMRRSTFHEVGGLDDKNLPVAYNDVDMCLRVRERGYWVVYTPHAVLFHHESATRSMHCIPGEEEYMKQRWNGVIRHDPFYNPNLTRDADDYSLNFDAPTVAQRLDSIDVPPLTSRHCLDSVDQRQLATTEHLASNLVRADPPPAVATSEQMNGYRPKRNRYPEVRRRIREVVNAELPASSVVAVVSRGDDNLLQLGPRRAWHFPRTATGVYAGFYPADSTEAIAHLEEVRRDGADYLLFPSTAFWWLAFYGDFQKYLESHYPCICTDPSCQIFQLSTNPRGY